jgi:hypothetical protein
MKNEEGVIGMVLMSPDISLIRDPYPASTGLHITGPDGAPAHLVVDLACVISPEGIISGNLQPAIVEKIKTKLASMSFFYPTPEQMALVKAGIKSLGKES